MYILEVEAKQMFVSYKCTVHIDFSTDAREHSKWINESSIIQYL